ncbi:MAG: phosphate acyltransferase PlsX [Ignavibacteria bacterium]
MIMHPIRIAIDVMGGDFAPLNEIQGAILASEKFKEQSLDVEFLFIGKEQDIRTAMKGLSYPHLRFSIQHADDVVSMHDDPTSVIKSKRQSSLFMGIDMHARGNADAFVSAGNTGAVMSTATVVLGRIKGVSRPTIGTFLPTQHGRPVLLLDVGATIECKPRFLFEYAIMGDVYSRIVQGIEQPKIGLLNIGEEETKGIEPILQTHALLKESTLNFIGNVEGRDVLAGTADVVICDGFVGNIVLKFAESMLGLLKAKIKGFAASGILNKLMVMLMLIPLKKILKDFDYQEYGGVPLLGVNGVIIIGHGKSSPLAIQNMLIRAVEVIQGNVNASIKQALAESIN